MNNIRKHPFRDCCQDLEAVKLTPTSAQTLAPAYRLAFDDHDFLTREDMRSVRLQLELMKPEIALKEHGIDSTVVLFGGARIADPDQISEDRGGLSHYYDEARQLAKAITLRSLHTHSRDWVIVTGGGPGVMEAGNRGATEAGGKSIGLNIVLPHEQAPNSYVTPELCFNFHYFAIRKMHFLLRARAICVFPGGFGTMDEMFEALTLIQTKRMAPIPFVLFGKSWWETVINWQQLAAAHVISPEDLELFVMVDTAEDALAAIDNWHHR